MSYVDGFVLPVPKKNLQAYRRMAQKAGKIWLEHGAIDYWECVGDDVPVAAPGRRPARPGRTRSRARGGAPTSVKLSLIRAAQ